MALLIYIGFYSIHKSRDQNNNYKKTTMAS